MGVEKMGENVIIIQAVKRGGSLSFNLKKEIQEKYGISEGDYLSISLENDGFRVRKIKSIIT